MVHDRGMTPHPHKLRQITRLLGAGAVIAYPTEAVFGLGCNPRDAAAVYRLLALKKRPVNKGLILIASEFSQLEPLLAPLEADQRRRLQRSWPGPVTWLIPARTGVPVWLRGRHDTLAVRVTSHPIASALCQVWGGPLVSSSANMAGHPPAVTALAVRRRLPSGLDYIVPGRVGSATRPSEIRDLLSGRVIRAG
jgi:L-threonylcarbamoyladenylate synthase